MIRELKHLEGEDRKAFLDELTKLFARYELDQRYVSESWQLAMLALNSVEGFAIATAYRDELRRS